MTQNPATVTEASPTYPCPAWCSGHDDRPLEQDHPSDRRHWRSSTRIELTLGAPIRVGGDAYPSTLDIGMMQHVLWAEPQVDLVIDEERDVYLTLSEARAVHAALGRVLSEAVEEGSC